MSAWWRKVKVDIKVSCRRITFSSFLPPRLFGFFVLTRADEKDLTSLHTLPEASSRKIAGSSFASFDTRSFFSFNEVQLKLQLTLGDKVEN